MLPTTNDPVPFAQWRKWYALARWRKRRQHQLALEPRCALCAQNGVSTFATIAHHEPHHGGRWIQFCTGPLQSLCENCHKSAKKYETERGYDPMIGVDGMPVDRRHPAYQQREPGG